MNALEYIEASKLNSDGNIEYVVHLLLTVHASNRERTSRMDIIVYPISITRSIGDRTLTTTNFNDRDVSQFDLVLSHHQDDRLARFATKVDVMLSSNLRGCGVGSYVFSKLIEWGKIIAPTYAVESLKLGFVDAETDEAKQTRNNFYSQLGFELVFKNDPTEKVGWARAASMSTLHTHVNKDKIRVLDPSDFITELQRKIEDNENLNEGLRKSVASYSNLLTIQSKKLFRAYAVTAFSIVALLAVVKYAHF